MKIWPDFGRGGGRIWYPVQPYLLFVNSHFNVGDHGLVVWRSG